MNAIIGQHDNERERRPCSANSVPLSTSSSPLPFLPSSFPLLFLLRKTWFNTNYLSALDGTWASMVYSGRTQRTQSMGELHGNDLAYVTILVLTFPKYHLSSCRNSLLSSTSLDGARESSLTPIPN